MNSFSFFVRKFFFRKFESWRLLIKTNTPKNSSKSLTVGDYRFLLKFDAQADL
jgi:hypothetical protein